MKTINDYKVGDIITIQHKGIFPKTIQKVMAKYRKKHGLPKTWEGERNHVMMVVEKSGVKMIADSNGKGTGIRQTLERYINNPNCLHFTWEKPLTEEEQWNFNYLANVIAFKSVPYDKWGLFAQLIYAKTGLWIGRKGDASQKKIYCSEFAALCMNAARDCFGTRTYNQNIVDIEICKELILIKND